MKNDKINWKRFVIDCFIYCVQSTEIQLKISVVTRRRIDMHLVSMNTLMHYLQYEKPLKMNMFANLHKITTYFNIND